MSQKSRNAKRVATIPDGPIVTVRSPFTEPCVSGKKKFTSADEAPTRGFNGAPLRWYACTLCQWIHVTSGGTIRWRKPGRGNVQPGQEGLARR